MKKGKYIITENRRLASGIYRMKLAGDVSAITAPGQFINIRLDGHFLRRPISVCDVEPADAYGGKSADTDAVNGTVTIIYKVLGRGTEEMTRLETGTELDVLTGLGNGYDLSRAGARPLLIGGGVGIPPLYLAARLLTSDIRDGAGYDILARDKNSASDDEYSVPAEDKPARRVSVILGFNSADDMYYADEFEALGCDVTVATADGSCGIHGFVTDAFREFSTECGAACMNESSEYERFTQFYTCGPLPMLRAVYTELYEEAGISGQMSFEERMGCGFGACMGCSIRTKDGYKRICKDGPVLRTEEIVWE